MWLVCGGDFVNVVFCCLLVCFVCLFVLGCLFLDYVRFCYSVSLSTR